MAAMIDEVPHDGDDGGHREPLERVQDAADRPGEREEEDRRHEDAQELGGERGAGRRAGELGIHQARERSGREGEDDHSRAHDDDDQAEQVGGQAIGALALALRQ